MGIDNDREWQVVLVNAELEEWQRRILVTFGIPYEFVSTNQGSIQSWGISAELARYRVPFKLPFYSKYNNPEPPFHRIDWSDMRTAVRTAILNGDIPRIEGV